MRDSGITPVELLNASIKRSKAAKKFNAYITTTEKLAAKQASESLNRYKQGAPKSDLDGIPIAIKDNFCTAQIRTTCAARMLDNFVPAYDATVYQRLAEAGAVLMGKCNLDQFAMGSGTVDSIYGPTKNPWGFGKEGEDFYIAGGSSGGCAVAVATHTCFA